MRRMVLLLALVVLLGGQARAAELPEDLTRSVPEAAGEVAGTDFQQGISALLDTVQEHFFSLLRQGMAGVVRLLMVLLLCGIGESLLQPLQEKNTFRYVTLAGTAAIVTVSAGDLSTLMGLGVETITQLSQFSKALLPTLAAATASAGMVGTASVKQVATVFFCDLLITMIHGLILPFLYLYIGAAAAGAMLGDSRLDAAARGLKKVITWVLTALLTVFTLYLSIAGIVAGAADATAVRLAKRAISTAVPVVGNVIAGAAETVLSGAATLKNSIGIFGVLAVLGTCAVPFLRIGMQYLLYKLAAFAAGTVSSPPLVKLVDSLGSAFGLILGMVGSCALLLTVAVLSSLLVVSI